MPFVRTRPTQGAICVKTSVANQRCGLLCGCRCHVRTHFKTPRSLSRIFGLLFYSYSGSLLPGRPCNYPHCKKSGDQSSQFTYYFPTWMVARAVSITSTYRDLSGLGASWALKVPRVISDRARIWYLIEAGNLRGVQDEFTKKLASPFDINITGGSLLLVSFKNFSCLTGWFPLSQPHFWVLLWSVQHSLQCSTAT